MIVTSAEEDELELLLGPLDCDEVIAEIVHGESVESAKPPPISTIGRWQGRELWRLASWPSATPAGTLRPRSELASPASRWRRAVSPPASSSPPEPEMSTRPAPSCWTTTRTASLPRSAQHDDSVLSPLRARHLDARGSARNGLRIGNRRGRVWLGFWLNGCRILGNGHLLAIPIRRI